MSDSSSLKQFPLASPNPHVERAWQFVRTPFAIAIFASLGVHGLLWFGLPYLPNSEAKKTDDQRAVDVIELSPLEQARLPQSSFYGSLNPSSTPGATQKKAGSMPSTNVPTVPTDPTVTDAVPYYSIPDLWGSATSTYSDSTQFNDDRSRTSKTTTTTTTKTTKSQEKTTKTEASTPKTSSSEQKTDPTKAQTTEKDEAGNVSTKAEDLDGETELERGQQQEDAQRVALREQYAYNADDPGLKDDAALGALTKFTEENGINVSDWAKVKDVSLALPTEACKVKTELGEALKKPLSVGAIVQPDGRLSKVVLFGSSGSKGLNQAAVDYLKGQEFPPSDKNSFLRFRITFEADGADCVAASADKPAS